MNIFSRVAPCRAVVRFPRKNIFIAIRKNLRVHGSSVGGLVGRSVVCLVGRSVGPLDRLGLAGWLHGRSVDRLFGLYGLFGLLGLLGLLAPCGNPWSRCLNETARLGTLGVVSRVFSRRLLPCNTHTT